MKNVMSTIGGGTADAARRVSGATTDAAKWVGGGSAVLARRVGPKRGLIGLAVVGAAAVGAIYLARYLRARRDELPLEGEELESMEASDAANHAARAKENHKRGDHAMH